MKGVLLIKIVLGDLSEEISPELLKTFNRIIARLVEGFADDQTCLAYIH